MESLVGLVKTHEVKKDGTLRIIIPKSIRLHLHIKKGDYLACYYKGGGKIIYVKQKVGSDSQ